MRAKEFFQQVHQAESELKVLNAKLRHYEDIGISLGSAVGAATGSGQRGSSRVELAAIGATDALRELAAQREHYLQIIAKAELIISRIPQDKYRKLLSYKYLCGWSFRSVADELDYHDPNSVYRAHGWALIAAQSVIDADPDLD